MVKYLKIVFILYAGALLLSWGIQYYFPTSDKPNVYHKEKIIQYQDVRITHSYFHLNNPASERTIVLFPDLFGGPEFLLPLAESLQDSINVIIPHYPKTTTGNRSVSYSVESRAQFADILLDSLNTQNVHLLGHGYGGLTSLYLASGSFQNRYESLILLSSYGPQELQFLGNHLINLSLYSMLYPAVIVFKYMVPHMGWFYEQPFDFTFTKSLTALDLRPVRSLLKSIETPVHILQPLQDRYISLPIANEIYRLVPQSSMFIALGDHATTKKNPAIWKTHIFDFLNRVVHRQANDRAEADLSRIEASNEPFDADDFDTIGGWTLIIIMFLIVVISLFSEDLACIAGGLLVASGIISFWLALLGCCIGVLGADILIYLLGRWVGNPILQWIPFRWFITEDDITRAEKMYRMRGVEIIFATRFLPGTRLPVYLVSGMIRVKLTFFLLYFVLAMLIWAPLLVGISALIGQPMVSYLNSYQEYALWLIPVILGIMYIIAKGVVLISTPTGRREIVVKIGRFRERYFY